ncbi:hypothetical protein HPB47_021354 [Ixodes persulcatus]|uniref:Uncharacterized protein n=1 Tax=Ixodes persulcatus TaxID=34615 RepID=A0AC60QF99_IXOPE|nr:hypothetical protein HPB47_021354 [Ixodes persulcatus]
MIEECTNEFLKIMEEDEAAQERGGIDISPAFCRLSLEILLRFTMSARLNIQAASEETEAILNAARNTARRFPLGWLMICTDLHAKICLVSLLKGGLKIVMRPRNGLDLRMWRPYQLIDYLANAVGASVEELVLGGRSYPLGTHLAAPDDSVEGVFRELITARMLGQSVSALIFFAGQILPRHVVQYGRRQQVILYRPFKQVCTTCVKEEHRADICRTPGTQTCPRCTSPTLAPGHACLPKCLLCDGDDPTGDKICQH